MCKNKKMVKRVRRFICAPQMENPPLYDSSKMKYLIYCKEKCPTTGNIHWQTYCELINAMSYKSIQDKFLYGTQSHIEIPHGTTQENIAYVRKEGKHAYKKDTQLEPVCEYGKPSEQGKRSDLDTITKSILGKRSLKLIAQDYPTQFIRYHKGFRELSRVVHEPVFRPDIKVIYIWGPSGSGKSRYAYETYPGAYTCVDNSHGWMDGYEDQSVVIFDEFEGKFPRGLLLKICDRYPVQVPVKGSFVNFCASTIIFTSNLPPHMVYGNDEAFIRRLSEFGEVQFKGVE